MRSLTLPLLFTLVLATLLPAQAPAPVVVQAATPAIKSPQMPASAENTGSLQATLKMLQDIKAANEETLRKQTATLEQLDELEKVADTIRTLSKRN